MNPKRVDRNHAAIRDMLRELKYKVADTHEASNGFPDLVVAIDTTTCLLLEVKMPGEKLTEAEAKFHGDFPVAIVHDIDEAIDAIEDAKINRHVKRN